MCVGLAFPLAILLLLCHPRPNGLEPRSLTIDFLCRCLAAALFKIMQHMNYVADPRQIDYAIPGSLILISQLENSRTDYAHWPVVVRLLSLWQKTQLKSQVLPGLLRERT